MIAEDRNVWVEAVIEAWQRRKAQRLEYRGEAVIQKVRSRKMELGSRIALVLTHVWPACV